MDVEQLIAEVFVRGSLWDQRDKNHHNRYILDKLWDKVAFKLNTTRIILRNKWKTLRDKFRTTLASLSKPRSGDEGKAPFCTNQWKYFESLLFLKDQFTPRPSSGNFKLSDEQQHSSCSVQKETEENVDVDEVNSELPPHLETMMSETDSNSPLQTQTSNTSFAKNQPNIVNIRHKRRTHDDIGTALLEIEKKKMKYIEEKKLQKGEEDEDLNFFKSLLPHIKMLSPFDKMSYRMKILQVTQELFPQNYRSESRSTIISSASNNANYTNNCSESSNQSTIISDTFNMSNYKNYIDNSQIVEDSNFNSQSTYVSSPNPNFQDMF